MIAWLERRSRLTLIYGTERTDFGGNCKLVLSKIYENAKTLLDQDR